MMDANPDVITIPGVEAKWVYKIRRVSMKKNGRYDLVIKIPTEVEHQFRNYGMWILKDGLLILIPYD